MDNFFQANAGTLLKHDPATVPTVAADTYINATANLSDMANLQAGINNIAAGVAVTNWYGTRIYAPVLGASASLTNAYGIKVENIGVGINRFAIQTGTGTVKFGDLTLVKNLNTVRYADQFAGADAGAKISACLADLPAGGETCDARGFEGSQTISATITVNKPVHLIGPGAAATFTLANGVNGNIFDITASDVLIEGFKIDGNKANQTGGNAFRSETGGLSNLTIRRNIVQNVYGRFALISGVDNLRIEENDVANCEQSGNNKAIQVHGANGSSTGIYVRRNRIDASASDNGGIVISSATALNTIAEIAINENEVIVGDAGATDTLGVEFFSSSGGFIQNFTARGNLVRNENATNANVFGISRGGGMPGNNQNGLITGNTILNVGEMSIEVVGCNSVTVSSNTVRDSGRAKIGGSSREVAIVGNTFDGAVAGASGNQHIEVDNSASQGGISIVGNTLRRSNLYGIQFVASTGTTGFVIASNVIDGDSQAISNMAGVRIEGANQGQVYGNVFRNFSGTNGRGLLITSTGGAAIGYWGNHFENIALDNVLNQALGSSTQEHRILENPGWGSGTSFTGQLDHAITADRTWVFPDADGNLPALPTAATTETGSGAVVRQTSPTLAGTPTIGDGAGNDKLEFAEEATNPTCAAGQYFVWANSTDNKLKKCQNGTISDLDTTGGAGGGYDTAKGDTGTASKTGTEALQIAGTSGEIATTAADGSPDDTVMISIPSTISNAKTVSALWTFDRGTTPDQAILISIPQPGAAGQRDSHFFDLTGSSFDTAGHDADWRQFVDVTSNAAASQLYLAEPH